jgi:probable rRNA maturation factor
MVYNHQRKVRLRLKALGKFAASLAEALTLGRRWFDVAFVDDREIQRLNREFRGKNEATDVLSFPWGGEMAQLNAKKGGDESLDGFLGDVIISAPTASREASEEKMAMNLKARQLVLHGALHLLGYDHETDHGEMEARECELRRQFGIDNCERNISGTPRTRNRTRDAGRPRATRGRGVTA